MLEVETGGEGEPVRVEPPSVVSVVSSANTVMVRLNDSFGSSI